MMVVNHHRSHTASHTTNFSLAAGEAYQGENTSSIGDENRLNLMSEMKRGIQELHDKVEV